MSKIRIVGAAIALAFLATACGNSDNGTTSSGATSGSTKQPGATVMVGTTNLGMVLVDNQGRTLYMLTADSAGKSTCAAGCASVWPKATLTSGSTPQAGSGVSAKLATVTPSDPTPQVTAAGHPLYIYSGDSKSGEVNGQGIKSYGGTWYVLNPDGTPITSSGGAGASPSSSGDGGYHY